ncbi:trehalose-phosphatase [Neorhizobium sp. IRS_2294]|uniref:trehalose-phosphatase n=1 Tax=unclassified Neorhizobium TaxID=2629175 RepID=UPI003D273757
MVDDTKASANAHTNTSDGTDILHEVLNQPGKWAVFFDIDGTLIDIADTPDGIVVPDDLAENLTRLSAKLSGAVALVTGRALPYADQLFKPHIFPIAGLHGAERRSMSGAIERVTPGPDFEALKASLAEEAAAWPGVLVEDKGLAVAAHYRQAPTFQGQVEAAMERYRERAGSDFTLQRGKMVVEIRPARASKGDALRAFLSEEPFAGRLPIAIGDDVTDEAMFRVANKLGGHSIRISDIAADTVASATLGSAAELRALIAKLAAA